MIGRPIARPTFGIGRTAARRHRRSVDWALVTGTGAIALMLALALYGPIIAPHDPWDTHFLLDGKLPPYDPSQKFPLGTDAAGRDRLSLLLWGARTTFSIAFAAGGLRLGLGAFLGVFAGWQGGTNDLWLSRLALGLSSVPATIAALLAVIAFNVYAGPLAFILALGIVGWGDAFHHARRATRTEAARPFIETARAVGMTEQRVVLRHLVPNLAPTLLTVGALQVSSVLLLLGELALIRIFVGGATVVDLFTQPQNLPSDPEWASLLGTTRPIYDLYGNTVAVLAPVGGLLAAVVSVNLFADALAQRAQRLDLFRLLTSRQTLAVAFISLAVVLPALLWPSPLTPELELGDRFDAGAALTLAQDLSDSRFQGRVAQSGGAAAAADLIRDRLGGELSPIHEQVVMVANATATSGTQRVSLGPDLAVLSPSTASVSGQLAIVDLAGGASIGGRAFNSIVAGRFAVVMTSIQGSVSAWEGFTQRAGGIGVIVLTDNPAVLLPSVDYPLPTIALTLTSFRTLIGQDLPTPTRAEVAIPLDVDVAISIAAPAQTVGGVNVLAHVDGRTPGGPVLLVAASYDAAPASHFLDYQPARNAASAVATLVGAAQVVRSAPLAAGVIFVATGSQQFDSAGLKAALRTLSAEEARRLVALVWIPSALGDRIFIQTDPSESQNPEPSSRVAGRVAASLGDASAREGSPALAVTLALAGIRAPTFQVGRIATEDTALSSDALHATGRALLTLLGYIDAHPEALQ